MGCGRYEEAEQLFLRALGIAEPLLGKHPKTARYIEGLGQCQAARANYKEALANFQRSLIMRDETLGMEHSETALSISGTATVLLALGHVSVLIEIGLL